jgi:site-specific recombinase XerD
MVDVYKCEKYFKRKLEKIEKDKDILPENWAKILEFKGNCVANGIRVRRALRYLDDLPKLSKLLGKPFEKATKQDMERVPQLMEASSYSLLTKIDFRVTLKKFYKWLNGDEEYPESVKWIKTTGKKNNNNLPEDLLTERKAKQMIQAVTNSRDRALIAVL